MKGSRILLLLIPLIVWSCDTRKDNYTGLDTGPLLQVA